jgi:hypothetical protein
MAGCKAPFLAALQHSQIAQGGGGAMSMRGVIGLDATTRAWCLILFITGTLACLANVCLMLALKAQSRLTGVIIESVILALLSLCGTILLRLQWADPQCGTMWFDAKDILSVASNYHRGAEHGGWQALLEV